MKVIKVGDHWGLLRPERFDTRQEAKNYLKAEREEKESCIKRALEIDAMLAEAKARRVDEAKREARHKASLVEWGAEDDMGQGRKEENPKRHLRLVTKE